MEENEQIKEALLKKALGYMSDEIVMEFSLNEDGQEILNKKKVTKKYCPPDISAVKILLEKFNTCIDDEISNMTDEELEQEKNRLLQLLKEENNED